MSYRTQQKFWNVVQVGMVGLIVGLVLYIVYNLADVFWTAVS